MTEDEWRERARDMCFNGVDLNWDDVQIDDDAGVSSTETGSGAWVQAWIWIPADEEVK